MLMENTKSMPPREIKRKKDRPKIERPFLFSKSKGWFYDSKTGKKTCLSKKYEKTQGDWNRSINYGMCIG